MANVIKIANVKLVSFKMRQHEKVKQQDHSGRS
jgi:hypothetical protein